MRKRIWVPGAIALAVLTAASIVTAGQTNNETTGVVRVERTFTSDWHYGCHQDACTGGPLAFPAISVVTPPAEATVDAVITVTMDYQTSLGDYGIVEMS